MSFIDDVTSNIIFELSFGKFMESFSSLNYEFLLCCKIQRDA